MQDRSGKKFHVQSFKRLGCANDSVSANVGIWCEVSHVRCYHTVYPPASAIYYLSPQFPATKGTNWVKSDERDAGNPLRTRFSLLGFFERVGRLVLPLVKSHAITKIRDNNRQSWRDGAICSNDQCGRRRRKRRDSGPSFTMKVLPLVPQGGLLTRGGDGERQIKNNARGRWMGPTCVRTKRIARVRMKEWPSLSLSLWYGFVLLNWIAYKCDRWRMSPNYRATPDSLSRASSAVALSPFLSRLLSARNGSANEEKKNGEIERAAGVARVSHFRFPSYDGINKHDWSFVRIYFHF